MKYYLYMYIYGYTGTLCIGPPYCLPPLLYKNFKSFNRYHNSKYILNLYVTELDSRRRKCALITCGGQVTIMSYRTGINDLQITRCASS